MLLSERSAHSKIIPSPASAARIKFSTSSLGSLVATGPSQLELVAHGSRLNPKLSAHGQMFDNSDCNQTPIALPGVRVIVHKTPDMRSTWVPRGIDGWCVGPSLESHRCHTI
jgi:hypothetical protein